MPQHQHAGCWRYHASWPHPRPFSVVAHPYHPSRRLHTLASSRGARALPHASTPAAGPSGTEEPGPPPGPGRFPGGIHRTQMKVRDYELDQFGVVNNAIYVSYLQHGRHEAFEDLGFPISSLTQDGSALALASLSLSYLGPLRSHDVFEVSVALEKLTAARMVLGQQITLVSPGVQDGRKPGQVVVKAEAVVVFLDSRYQPVRIPANVRSVLTELLAVRQAAADAPA